MNKITCSALLLVATMLISQANVYGQEPVGSEFTFQGQLKDAGFPANGYYDFEFRLYDTAAGGTQIGNEFEAEEQIVTDGLFTIQLDFGASAFTGDARWIEIDVRDSDGGLPYTTLSPRQPVSAAPVALYALDAPGSGGYWTPSGDDIYNNNAGGVGIGTTIPASMLDVRSTAGTHGVMSEVPWIPVWAHRTSTSGTWPAIHGECDSEDPDGSAVRGIMTSASSGADSAGVRGTNSGYGYGVYGWSAAGTGVFGEADSDWSAAVRGFNNAPGFGYGVYGVHYGEGWGACGISYESTGVRGITHADWYDAGVHGHNSGIFGYGVHGTTDGDGIGVYGEVPSGIGVFGDSTDGTGVYGSSTNGYAGYFNGTVSVNVLEIAGADVAEKFPVSEEVKPGMVVVIDAEHPGKLCLSRGSYDRRVAGVVSGANDLPVGAVLGHLPGSEDAPPIALSGRVWVYCDATDHPIEVGDLLTTSETPGHAMKALNHNRSQGAILGKAMTELKEVRGLVLVLVSLQ